MSRLVRWLAGRNTLRRPVDRIEGVVLVVPAGLDAAGAGAFEAGAGAAGPDRTVAGGVTRSESVRAGLAAVPPDVPVIVVHDAVRPLAAPELFRAVVAAVVAGADCALPGVAVSDTVKQVDAEGRVEATIDRSRLVLVQTPQAFSAPALRRAHEGAGDATDDAALVEAAGGSVVVVPGDPANIKITHARDLAVAEALLAPPCG